MSVAPKRPTGPPLNAMRAFEAAARHVSFVLAAEELNVTAGAISQHVKTLETWAGTALFRRNAQGVVLSPAGQALVQDFTAAFDRLADATCALRNIRPHTDFHIAALPSVAQLWLPRRLRKIRENFPHISFSVTAMETPPNLAREMYDFSVFIGPAGDLPNQISICEDTITPVCAPSLLEQARSPDCFDITPLLHDQTWLEDWHTWSQAADVQIRNDQRGPRFSLYSLAVEEAKVGAGLLMGHLCLIQDALCAGTLATVCDISCSTGKSLVVQLPPASRRQPEMAQIIPLLTA